MFYKSSKNIVAILTIIIFAFAGCGDDDSSVSLDGNLSYRVEGTSSNVILVNRIQILENDIFQDGVTQDVAPFEGDLEDGDFKGYVLAASPFGGGEPDITLMLLSNGDVIAETSSTNDDGFFEVRVGDTSDI